VRQPDRYSGLCGCVAEWLQGIINGDDANMAALIESFEKVLYLIGPEKSLHSNLYSFCQNAPNLVAYIVSGISGRPLSILGFVCGRLLRISTRWDIVTLFPGVRARETVRNYSPNSLRCTSDAVGGMLSSLGRLSLREFHMEGVNVGQEDCLDGARKYLDGQHRVEEMALRGYGRLLANTLMVHAIIEGVASYEELFRGSESVRKGFYDWFGVEGLFEAVFPISDLIPL
jgi:hypothetical protein